MPKNLTSTGEDFPTQTSPVSGEPRTAGSVETPFQRASDRTEYLKQRLAFLDPTKEGARRIRRVASLAALRALEVHEHGTVAYVDGGGLYQFIDGSLLAELPPIVLTPDVGGGRWISAVRGLLDTSWGIPMLNADGRLPMSSLAARDPGQIERLAAGAIRNSVVDQQFMTITSASTSATALTDAGGSPISVQAVAGDQLEVVLSCNAAYNATEEARARLQVQVTQPNSATITPIDFEVGDDESPRSASRIITLSQTGTHVVTPRHCALSEGLSTLEGVQLIARVWRP